MSAFIVPWYIYDWAAAVGTKNADFRLAGLLLTFAIRIWMVLRHPSNYLRRLLAACIFRAPSMG